MNLTGLRTYLVAAVIALVPNIGAWALGVDWVDVLTNIGVPKIAILPLAGAISGAVTAYMRSITTSAPAPISRLFSGDAGK